MTMQHDLPWNVAGIAPEAREAARTSARREGLSVGEWLTRRILNGVETESTAVEWWSAQTGRTAAGPEKTLPHAPPRAPISNDDVDYRNGSGRMDTARSNGLERIESIERLAARLTHLDARVTKAEVSAAAETIKQREAAKLLLTRIALLSAEIAKTGTHNAQNTAELARAVEALAEKVSQLYTDADERRHTIDERFSAISENVASLSGKIEDSHEGSWRELHVVEERVTAMEASVEELRREAGTVERLDGSVEALTRRFETTETEYLNNFEHLENRLTRIEAEPADRGIDQRLQGIELALAELTRLIEKNAGDKPGTPSPSVDETARSGSERPPLELGEPAPAAPPGALQSPLPILDLPPFPERPKTAPARPADPAATAAALDLRAGSPADAPDKRSAGFSWIDPVGETPAEKATNMRIILLGAIAVVALVAIGTGFYLSSTFSPSVPAPAHTGKITRTTSVPVKARAQISASARAVPQHTPPAQPAAAPAIRMSNPAGTKTFPKRAASLQTAPSAATTRPPAPQARLAALANAGNAKAQEVLGLEYLDGDGGVAVNEAEGAKWLQRAARQGEAVAAYRLGTLYGRGHGVVVNPSAATQWYASAAKVGNRKAMHNLAVAYAQGAGVPKDVSLAAAWFGRAANLGLADSQFNLAVLYERGMGVRQSLVEAYKWYAIAAAQGDVESRNRMLALASQITPGDRAVAEKAAARFRPQPLDRAANAPPVATSLVGG